MYYKFSFHSCIFLGSVCLIFFGTRPYLPVLVKVRVFNLICQFLKFIFSPRFRHGQICLFFIDPLKLIIFKLRKICLADLKNSWSRNMLLWSDIHFIILILNASYFEYIMICDQLSSTKSNNTDKNIPKLFNISIVHLKLLDMRRYTQILVTQCIKQKTFKHVLYVFISDDEVIW